MPVLVLAKQVYTMEPAPIVEHESEEHPKVGQGAVFDTIYDLFAGEFCLFRSSDDHDEFCINNELAVTVGFKFEQDNVPVNNLTKQGRS